MQTETPQQLEAANKKAAKGNSRKCVARESVAILSQGTLSDPAMLAANPEATWLATLVELPAPDAAAVPADAPAGSAGAASTPGAAARGSADAAPGSMGSGDATPVDTNGDVAARAEEVSVGVCAVEVAQGRVLLGQFRDGPLRSGLQRCFTGALPAFALCKLKRGGA